MKKPTTSGRILRALALLFLHPSRCPNDRLSQWLRQLHPTT